MKRQHTEKYEHGVFIEFPIFSWRHCVICNNEFRRERGWCFLSEPFRKWRYICGGCCKTKKNCHAAILKGDWRGPKLKR